MNVAKTIPLAVAVLVLGGYAFLDHTGTLKKWFDKPPVELLRPNLEQLTGRYALRAMVMTGAWRSLWTIRQISNGRSIP